jgi:hypothetical protein
MTNKMIINNNSKVKIYLKAMVMMKAKTIKKKINNPHWISKNKINLKLTSSNNSKKKSKSIISSTIIPSNYNKKSNTLNLTSNLPTINPHPYSSDLLNSSISKINNRSINLIKIKIKLILTLLISHLNSINLC